MMHRESRTGVGHMGLFGLAAGLLDVFQNSSVMWHEARGSVLRQQFDDAMMRIKVANYPAMRGFYGNIEGTIEELREAYRPASSNERKAILEHCRKSMHRMWNQGDWPSALGLG